MVIAQKLKNQFLFSSRNSNNIHTLQRSVDKALTLALILLLVYFSVEIIVVLLDIKVLRHDALPFLFSYKNKLLEEGRWLNYLFFPLLKEIRPTFAILVSLLCWCYFNYIVAKNFTSDLCNITIFILLSLLVPSFYALTGWPLTLLLNFVVLAFIAFISNKVHPFLLFLISGILFFGLFNNFYNLTLLLVLSKEQEVSFKKLIKILAMWISGYIAGFFLMTIFLKCGFNQFGLKIADWRLPNPIHGLNDVVINLKRARTDFRSAMELVGGRIAVVAIALSICILVAKSIVKQDKKIIFVCVGLVCLALSCFAQSFPLGLGVAIRTNFPLYSSIFFFLLILTIQFPVTGKIFSFCIASLLFLADFSSLEQYLKLTNVWRSEILKMNVPPASVKEVVICSTDQEVASSENKINNNLALKNYFNQGFSTTWRQYSIFYSVGYRHFSTQKCSNELKLNSNKLPILSWTKSDGKLYVWY